MVGAHRSHRHPDRLGDRRCQPPGPDAASRHTRRCSKTGLLEEIETIWLNRGCDSGTVRAKLHLSGIDDAVPAKKNNAGTSRSTAALVSPSGLRWLLSEKLRGCSRRSVDYPSRDGFSMNGVLMTSVRSNCLIMRCRL